MNKIIVGVIAIVIAIFLLRGCLQSDRRADFVTTAHWIERIHSKRGKNGLYCKL